MASLKPKALLLGFMLLPQVSRKRARFSPKAKSPVSPRARGAGGHRAR